MPIAEPDPDRPATIAERNHQTATATATDRPARQQRTATKIMVAETAERPPAIPPTPTPATTPPTRIELTSKCQQWTTLTQGHHCHHPIPRHDLEVREPMVPAALPSAANSQRGAVAGRSRSPKITNDDAMGRTARTPATLCQDPRRLNPACEGAPDAIPHAVGARGTLSAAILRSCAAQSGS